MTGRGVRSADFLVVVPGILAQSATAWLTAPPAVRRAPFAFTLRVRFTDGYRRGRIFHFSTAGGLEKWIRLPQSACGDRSSSGWNYGRPLGRWGETSIVALRRHLLSGSPYSSHQHPTGLIPGRLSHGSRIPNSFWNTCSAVWTRPQRLQKAV